jgi:hypothetical protein
MLAVGSTGTLSSHSLLDKIDTKSYDTFESGEVKEWLYLALYVYSLNNVPQTSRRVCPAKGRH